MTFTYNGNTYLANSILVDGLKYKAAVGLEVDQQQITVAARSTDTITGGAPFLQALRDGAFDGCEIVRDRVFFSDRIGGTAIGAVTLFKGRLGTIDEIGRTSAKLTVNSDLVLLDIDMPRNVYQPTCLHTLYDSGCTLIKNAFGISGTVGAGSTASMINWTGANANFQQGTITFTSGVNAGVTATVGSAVAGTSLTLIYPLESVPSLGDGFTVYFGCDHTPAPARPSSTIWRISAAFLMCRRRKWRSENGTAERIAGGGGAAEVFDGIDERQRAAVVAEARSWIGTPYHNCADIKGVGVDCGMLLVRVFVDTGLCQPFDPRPYPIDWHLHRGEERYLGFVFDRSREVTEPQPGDVDGVPLRPQLRARRHRHHGTAADHRARLPSGAHGSRGGDRTTPCLPTPARAAALLQPWATESHERAVWLRGEQTSTRSTPDYTGLQIQTAVNTLPVPIVWGASKLAPNVIWYNNFQTSQGGGKGGGKGGLFGGGASETTYSAAVIMALCEGPDHRDQPDLEDQSVYTLSELGLSLFTGTTPQSAWSYLATAYPSQALAYQGTVMCAHRTTASATARRSTIIILRCRALSSAAGSTESMPIPPRS